MTDWLRANADWLWWVLATVLIVLELMTPGVYLLWFGIAAALTGALLLVADFAWQYQLLAFAVLAVASLAVGRVVYRQGGRPTDEPALNRRAESYRGRVFTLAEPIRNGDGWLKVEDTLWKARGPDLPAGAKVRVVGADGVVLKVEPAEG